MRIRDWSSDVCSSDLTQGQAVFAGGLRDMAAVVRLTAKLRGILVRTLAVAALMLFLVWAMVMLAVPYVTAPMLQDAMPDIRFEQIGRASCREQTVSVRVDLGGRRHIKKKKTSK